MGKLSALQSLFSLDNPSHTWSNFLQNRSSLQDLPRLWHAPSVFQQKTTKKNTTCQDPSPLPTRASTPPGSSPAIRRSMRDLPMPLGPSSATRSPRWSVRGETWPSNVTCSGEGWRSSLFFLLYIFFFTLNMHQSYVFNE